MLAPKRSQVAQAAEGPHARHRPRAATTLAFGDFGLQALDVRLS